MPLRTFTARVCRSIAVLASIAYGGIGLLGYGLHDLAGCHHAAPAGQSGGESRCCGGHEHDHGPASDEPALARISYDCSICSFLAQAQTSVIPPLTVDGAQPVLAATFAVPGDVPFAPIRASLARGPPRV